MALTIFVGIFFSPIIIRKLGPERYGVWILVFSMVDYFRFAGLGIRSAVVYYCARHYARREMDELNRVMSTGSFFYGCAALFVLVAGGLVSLRFTSLFKISPQYHEDTTIVVVVVLCSVAVRFLLMGFSAHLEALQRFDLINRQYMAVLLFRSVCSVGALMLGYGLVALAWIAMIEASLEGSANWFVAHRVCPELRLSWTAVDFQALKRMARFGAKSFVLSGAGVLLAQGPPSIIGHYLPVAFVGFYAVAVRTLSYCMEAVAKVGTITGSRSANLDAIGQHGQMAALATCINRYCLALCLPLTIFMPIYGRELFLHWLGPEYAIHSAPLLPMLVAAITVAWASQFNAVAVLVGLGRHGRYAMVLILESVLILSGSVLVVSRYGVPGVVWVVSVVMTLTRGVAPAILFCSIYKISLLAYTRSVFLRPAWIGVPVAALMFWLKSVVLPGTGWGQLMLAGAITTGLCLVLTFRFVLAEEHRRRVTASGLLFMTTVRRAVWPGPRVTEH